MTRKQSSWAYAKELKKTVILNEVKELINIGRRGFNWKRAPPFQAERAGFLIGITGAQEGKYVTILQILIKNEKDNILSLNNVTKIKNCRRYKNAETNRKYLHVDKKQIWVYNDVIHE